MNDFKNRTVRTLIALTMGSVIALPAFAQSSAATTQTRPAQASPAAPTQRSQPPQAQPNQQVRQAPTVSYYTGDPLKGGRLISSVTLTLPQDQNGRGQNGAGQGSRGQGQQGAAAPRQGAQTTPQTGTQRPTNPLLAQAPAGAKFAVLSGPRGDRRIVDLSQVDQMDDHMDGGRGGRGGPQNGSQDSQPGNNR